MRHLLNFPMMIEGENNFEIGQRVLIQRENCTGRYIGDCMIIYEKKKGNPRLLKIINSIIHDISIDKKSPEYRAYNKILGKMKYDSK